MEGLGPTARARAKASSKIGTRGRLLSPDDVRRTTGGVTVWWAAAGAAMARRVMSVAVRLKSGGRRRSIDWRWEISDMLGACLLLSHGAVLGIVQVCTSMHPRGAGGHPCATSGCQEARRRGKRETTERAAPAGPVSQEFASPAALVVDGDPRVQETLRPALVALGLAVTFEQQPDAALALLMQRRSDVALLALELGSVDGFALMRA